MKIALALALFLGGVAVLHHFSVKPHCESAPAFFLEGTVYDCAK